MNRHHPISRPKLKLPVRVVSVLLSIQLLAIAVLSGGGSANAATEPASLQLSARSAILMDAETGQIMYQKDADIALPPASMSKMMTEYLVMKAVKNGTLQWDQVVTVGENAALQVGSRIFLAQGDKHTVRELYIAMAVGSANDASVQLAETVAGSEEEFVKLMNDTAKQLGMNDSVFVNATGLDRADMPEKYQPTSVEGETVMSARDLATLAYHILKEEGQEFLEVSSMVEYKFRPRDKDTIKNINWMLEGYKDWPSVAKFSYEGVDGLKTGHTPTAGNCFTGTAMRNGTRLIAVVMGVGGTNNEGLRFLETAKLFDYGFNNFEKKTVLAAKTAVPEHETLPIKKGKSKSVPVITASDITILMPKTAAVEPQVQEVVGIQDPLVAPVKQGDKVGTVTYKYTDPATSEEKVVSVDLVAAEDVNKASWWTLLLRSIGQFFSNLFQGIVDLF